jgi:hypothetical protein
MRHILSFAISAICIFHAGAYNNLYVSNPQGWGSVPGNITNAKITLEPKGMFVRYDLEMDIAANEWYGNESDQLEIVLDFSLPKNAMVIESYLLVGDSMVKAELRDAWSANLIYESIVNRRKDPSVLNKHSATQYQLRVYPLLPKSYRKVICSYYLPASLLGNEMLAPLPLNLINKSFIKLESLEIYVNSKGLNGQPGLLEKGAGIFKTTTLDGQDYWHAKPKLSGHQAMHVTFPSPLENGLYFAKYATGTNEGIYQLALMPSSFISDIAPAKLLVVLDYDVSNTTILKKDLYTMLSQILVNYLSPTDSFNILLSKLNPVLLKEDWIAADSASALAALGSLEDKDLSDFSNLKSTLAKALEMSQENNCNKILLITASDDEGDYKTANSLINDLLIYGSHPAIHSISIGDNNVRNYYQGGRNYFGNEYFLAAISTKTSGSFHSIYGYNAESLSNILKKVLDLLKGNIHNPDLYTSCQNGFCYSRFMLNDIKKGSGLNTPLIQTGKFIGDAPFEAQFSGIMDKVAISKSFTFENEDIQDADSSLARFYAGLYIDDLESGQHTNDIINAIIYESQDYRVLSRYTTFMALEPGMDADSILKENENEKDNIWIDVPTDEGWGIIDIENMDKEISPEIYPNPFVDGIHIELGNLMQSSNVSDKISITIVNAMGQTIKVLEANIAESAIYWDGTTDSGLSVSEGMYFVIIKTGNKVFKQKVVKK